MALPVRLDIRTGFAVLKQVHQLHQHNHQAAGAVQTKAVQRRLQAGHMAVMVGTPDIDDFIEAAFFKFVAVIGDISGEIGVKSVGTAGTSSFSSSLST